jgi:hypothetical protein
VSFELSRSVEGGSSLGQTHSHAGGCGRELGKTSSERTGRHSPRSRFDRAELIGIDKFGGVRPGAPMLEPHFAECLRTSVVGRRSIAYQEVESEAQPVRRSNRERRAAGRSVVAGTYPKSLDQGIECCNWNPPQPSELDRLKLAGADELVHERTAASEALRNISYGQE